MTLRNHCRAVRDLLEESACGLLDGPEAAPRRARLDAHLAGCEACRDVLARERSITQSLHAISRVQVLLPVEERVMAAVRREATKRPAQRLSRKQTAVLGSAALAATFGEAAFWAAVALAVLQLPGRSALLAPLRPLAGPALAVLNAMVEMGTLLARAAGAVLGGLALLLPPPTTMAFLFVSSVMVLTFIAVRRDLQRSPAAARGLR
jgi:anti-sigma factor RsiW